MWDLIALLFLLNVIIHRSLECSKKWLHGTQWWKTANENEKDRRWIYKSIIFSGGNMLQIWRPQEELGSKRGKVVVGREE